MPKRVKHVRHSSAASASFVGVEGEFSVELPSFNIRVHDGATPGGHLVPTEAKIKENFQEKKEVLTSIAGLTSSGLIAKVNNSAVLRTISASGYLGVTNGNGVAGNPTITWEGPVDGIDPGDFPLNANLPTILGSALVPVGGIILWYGSIASIPTNYALCDGTGGTPSLENKMPIGADGEAGGVPTTSITGSPLQTGGTKDISSTSSSAGTHSHGGATASHALTNGQIPNHTHYVVYSGSGSGYTYDYPIARQWLVGNHDPAYDLQTASATANSGVSGGVREGYGSGHSHTVSSDGSHTHSVSATNGNLPPFRAVHFIMRVS